MEKHIVGKTPEERAELIKTLETGFHAGETHDGLFCIISVVQGESMFVKVQVGARCEITYYNSSGEAVSHQS